MDNARFTLERGEPWHARRALGQSAWWKWRPLGAGVVTISAFTNDAAIRPVVAVYEGSGFGQLRLLRVNVAPIAGRPARLDLPTGAVEYAIAVDSVAASGRINLALSFSGAPGTPLAVAGSDSFAQAEHLQGTRALGVINNTYLSTESGEPQHLRHGVGKTAWWRWRAPSTQMFTVTVEGIGVRAGVVAYTDAGTSPFQRVAAGQSTIAGVPASATFAAMGGQEYSFVADTLSGDVDSGDLTLRLSP